MMKMNRMMRPAQMLLKQQHKKIQKGCFNKEMEETTLQSKLTNLKQELQDEFNTKQKNERLEIQKGLDNDLCDLLCINISVSTALTIWLLIWLK